MYEVGATGNVRRQRYRICVESTLQPGDYYRVQRQEAQLPQRNSASATHVFLGCKAKLIVRFTARTVRFTARLTAIRS